MNQLIPKLVQLTLGFLLVLPLTACAGTSLSPVTGQVLEAETRKPIPDALVVGLWYGTSAPGFFVDSTTVCYHVAHTTTDPNGRYTLPPTEKERKYQDGDHYTAIWAYRRGYEDARRREGNTVLLQPSTGGRGERLKYLLHFSSLVGCYGAGEEKSLVPVYKALYDEAKIHATSDKDKDALQTIRRRALYAWSRPSRELTSREIEQAIQNDPYLREQFK